MNKRMMQSVRILALSLAVILILLGCSKRVQNPGVEESAETAITEVAPEKNTVDSVEENTTAVSDDSIAAMNDSTTPETTAMPTEEEIVCGGSEEEITSEPTITLEEMPVITTPAIQEKDNVLTEYEIYLSMSGEEQQNYMQSFDSVEAFFNWHTAAKEEYENTRKDVEITGDEVISINQQ